MTVPIETPEQLEALLTWARASILIIYQILESSEIIPKGIHDSQKQLLDKLLSGEIDYKTYGNEDRQD